MKLSADKRRVTLAINEELDTAQIEDLIAELADLRAEMEPGVPMERPTPGNPATRVAMQDDPSFTAVPLKDGRTRFWLRSHGYGWLVFNFTRAQSAILRDFFIANAPENLDTGPNLFRDGNDHGNTAH